MAPHRKARPVRGTSRARASQAWLLDWRLLAVMQMSRLVRRKQDFLDTCCHGYWVRKNRCLAPGLKNCKDIAHGTAQSSDGAKGLDWIAAKAHTKQRTCDPIRAT